MSEPLIIEAPRQGMAQSPVVGFGDVRNVDIYSEPGVVKLNVKLSKASDSVVTSVPKWAVRNPVTSTDFYNLDASGNLYYSSNSGGSWKLIGGNSLSSAHGNGMEIFKDWLAVARDTVLDFYGPLTGVTFTATSANPMVITSVAHGLSVDDRITLWSTGTLTSAGAVVFTNTGTAYFVATVLTADTFTVSSTSGGIELSLAAGTNTGTHNYKTWKTSFQTIDSDVLYHPMIVSKLDNKLYGGEANQVYSLAQVAGQTFNPRSSGTYTWTNDCMTTALPTGSRIKCLGELGELLRMGTWQGTLATDFPVADIYSWDRSSASYEQPTILKDYGCHAMFNTGNSMVVLAGNRGIIYKFDGANIYPIASLPIDITPATYLEWYPGSICWYKGKVFFGSGFASSTSATIFPQGVWSLEQTGKGNILVLEHTNSQETDGSTVPVKITTLCPVSDTQLLVGYVSDTTNAIDITSSGSYAYTTDYSGGFDTPLYPVGSPQAKRLFTQLGLLFEESLRTGEGVKIWYRNSLTDTFKDLGTFTADVAGTTKLGLVSSYFQQASAKGDQIQFRIRLLGTTTTTPSFRSAILT